MQLSDYEMKAICAFRNSILDGKWSSDGLVSMLKVITGLEGLDIRTVKNASDKFGKSTQWLRTTPSRIDIDGVQFIMCINNKKL